MSESSLEALIRRTLTTVADVAVTEADAPAPSGTGRAATPVGAVEDWLDLGVDAGAPVKAIHEVVDMAETRGGHSEPAPGRGRARLVYGLVAAMLIAVTLGAIALLPTTTTVPPASQGVWSTIAPGPLSPRFAPGSVWTGSELVIFGGWDTQGRALVDGAAYDPETDRWRSISDLPTVGEPVVSAPFAQPPNATWLDGRIMTVAWTAGPFGWDVLSYDPATDRWTVLEQYRFEELPTDEIVPIGDRPGIHVPAAVEAWQDQMYVVGFRSDLSMMGWATYNPIDGTWSEFHAFASDQLHGYRLRTTVLDDRYLIVLNDHGTIRQGQVGVRIDLHSQETIDLPIPGGQPEGSWWSLRLDEGGLTVGLTGDPDGRLARVAYRLAPASPSWANIRSPQNSPSDDGPGELLTAGDDHLYLGGLTVPGKHGGLKMRTVALAAGPEVERWFPLPPSPIELDRTGHIVVWTGEEVLVWGGATVDPAGPVNRASVPLTDGGRYRIGRAS